MAKIPDSQAIMTQRVLKKTMIEAQIFHHKKKINFSGKCPLRFEVSKEKKYEIKKCI
jgi:hypothetical protein